MTASTQTALAQRAAAEIEDLHRVLQAWFRGEGPSDSAGVMAHFDVAYRMIGASGAHMTYAQLAGALPQLYGSRPTLTMEISDIAVLHASQDTAVLTYKERQAQDSGANERWATVLFVDRPGNATPLWRYLQETYCAP